MFYFYDPILPSYAKSHVSCIYCLWLFQYLFGLFVLKAFCLLLLVTLFSHDFNHLLPLPHFIACCSFSSRLTIFKLTFNSTSILDQKHFMILVSVVILPICPLHLTSTVSAILNKISEYFQMFCMCQCQVPARKWYVFVFLNIFYQLA